IGSRAPARRPARGVRGDADRRHRDAAVDRGARGGRGAEGVGRDDAGGGAGAAARKARGECGGAPAGAGRGGGGRGDRAAPVAALVEGRGGDLPRALRLVTACIRVEEGLVADADLLTLGVLTNLARLRLAALRDLAPPLDATPLVGPDLEARYRDAVLVEAAECARGLMPPAGSRARGVGARAADFLFARPG